ncbi:MAG: type I 3-dehydroquinate dehydratase [Kiritimatiellia bacterium]
MKKPSFLACRRPLLVDMMLEETPSELEGRMRRGIYDGAEAFGIQLERLRPEYRNEATLKPLFAYAEDRPLYVTNYRSGHNAALDDGARMAELELALRCGATLLDLTGDTFAAPEPTEMTADPAAIARQRALIAHWHELGAEVLMSAHVLRFLPEERVVAIALEQQSRGADIAKIVTYAGSEDELAANLNTIRALRRELRIPFLFLADGPYCKPQRVFGPYFGVAMWLCTDTYDALASRNQPLLRAMATAARNIDVTPNLRPGA